MSSKELKDTIMKKLNIQEAETLEKKQPRQHTFDYTDTSSLIQEPPNKYYLLVTFFFGQNLIYKAQTRNQRLEIDA